MRFIGGQFFVSLGSAFGKIAAQVTLFDAFYTEVVVVGLQVIGDSASSAVVGFVGTEPFYAGAQVVGFLGQEIPDEPWVAGFSAINGDDDE